MSTSTSKPVVLTGRVFVHGPLAEDFPANASPATEEFKAGDLRVHSHLDAAGTERRRKGLSQDGYSGVLRASLYDGKQWRTFMLALEVSSEIRHFTKLVYRAPRVRQILQTLARLKGFTCGFRDRCYAVNRQIPPQVAASGAGAKAALPVRTARNVAPAGGALPAGAPGETVPTSDDAVPTSSPAVADKAKTQDGRASTGCPCMTGPAVSTKRNGRSRRRKSAPNQLELF